MLSLTEEQFDVLDITENNPRVIVHGCAGTGKSLLALEKVRACAAKEKKVLYLCFNKNMASYAKNSLADADQDYITVSTFHALLIKLLGDANLYKMSIKELCEEYLRQAPNITLYDYIVIDEGQDLLIAEVFDIIDSLLVNGLNKGKWVMFLDPNQNIFNQSADYDFAMEYLRDCCSPVVYTLNYNCRNTEQIALRTAALSLVPPAKKLKITGPKVVAKSYDDRKDFVLKFKKELLSVVSGGLAAKDIVILSKKKLQNSLLSELNSVCNLTITEHENITDFSKSSFNFCTIQSYKGLESNIVFLIDVDGFADHHSRLLNYVAMSRAKLLLYIFYDQNCQEEYLDTLDKGRDMLAEKN
jgi:superfamily I DNA/RNA helicase